MVSSTRCNAAMQFSGSYVAVVSCIWSFIMKVYLVEEDIFLMHSIKTRGCTVSSCRATSWICRCMSHLLRLAGEPCVTCWKHRSSGCAPPLWSPGSDTDTGFSKPSGGLTGEHRQRVGNVYKMRNSPAAPRSSSTVKKRTDRAPRKEKEQR